MAEKVFFVKKTVPEKEIPENIKVYEIEWDRSTERVFSYELKRIEPDPNDEDFVKVVYKKVKDKKVSLSS